MSRLATAVRAVAARASSQTGRRSPENLARLREMRRKAGIGEFRGKGKAKTAEKEKKRPTVKRRRKKGTPRGNHFESLYKL